MFPTSLIVTITLWILTAAIGVLVLLWIWYQRKFRYWSKRNVRYLTPSFPMGNISQIATGTGKPLIIFFKDLYFENKDVPYLGLYTFYNPALLVNDLDLIKRILVKDADHFSSHGTYSNPETDPLSGHLFKLEGAEWKLMRSKLSPTFSSGKLKLMYNTMFDVANEMEDFVGLSAQSSEPVEFKEILARYATDVIGRCAFGIDCNSFKDSNSEFRKQGARIMAFTSVYRAAKNMASMFVPELIKFFNIKVDDAELEKFFTDIVLSSIKYREANNIERNDFLELLIKLKNNDLTDDQGNLVKSGTISLKQITAQVFVFFFAGFETSSTTASFTLYEMALNPDIQSKLRSEIREVLERYEGKCTYEAVKEMTYLECVVKETLRMYPPVGVLPRRCTKDYKVPDRDLTIEKGTLIFISATAIQRDERYFAEPDKYDPNRFLPENRDNIPNGTYLPFGDGPRFCIGERFGFMQSRLAVIKILTNYEVSVCEKTAVPMEYAAHSGLVLSSKDGMWLKLKEVNFNSDG